MPGRLGPWVTILAGRELHDFTSADRDRSVHCRHVFRDFIPQLGTDQYLSILGGDAHKHMRRMIAPAFAREAYAPYVKEMIELVCERARAMPVGKSVRWSDLANQVVLDLAWLATTNCRDPIPAHNVILYGKIFVGSGAVGWPRLLFRLPAYVAAKKKFNPVRSARNGCCMSLDRQPGRAACVHRSGHSTPYCHPARQPMRKRRQS